MKMLQCQFILSILLVLNGCFYEVSCQTIYTYTSKETEMLPCTKAAETVAVTWSDTVDGAQVKVLEYSIGDPPTITVSPLEKYENFHYTLDPTSFNLVIMNVDDEDGGRYTCAPIGIDFSTIDVTVEVLAKPTVKNGSQDVDVLDVIGGTLYDLTCSAVGARSVKNLSLKWDPSLLVKTPLSITPSSDDYKDYSITSTYTAKKGDSSITCQLTGYEMQDEINDQRMELISHTVNLNVRYAPVCNMTLLEGEDCRNVKLTCECEAVPADITQYSFFDGSSEIYDGANKTFTLSVDYGTLSSFSCNATNSIGSGDQTPAKDHNCDEATESTTEELKPNPTNEPGGLTTGAKIGISLGAVAVVVVIVVVAVILWKNGEDDSKPSDDKLDDNGAGPRGDPEIPAYGVVDKNRTKDPTPAPRSSMRDSKNPSNPKQDGPMEMQYADLDHGNKPASDEVRKPKEEPTEYATVQSVIV